MIKKSIQKLFYQILQNSDRKTIFANFGYLSLLQIAGYIFPLLTMPYLARVIGTEGFGKIAFASAIIVWVQTIADWGFTFTATRDVAQNRNDKEKVSQIFSNVLWARLFLTLIAGVILFIIVLTVPYLRENALIIFITFLLVPGHILFPDWFFQAVEKMKYTTIYNLTIKFIFTIAVFLFIHEKNDYILQPIFITIGYILCGICALHLIINKWKYTIYPPHLKNIITTIKSSFDVFLNNLMPNLYNSFSIMLIGFWGGSVANGLYDGGNRFPTIFYSLQSVLSRTFFPFLSRKPEKHHLFSIINLGSAALGSILLFLLSPWIIKIMLGEAFESSIIVMRILSISVIFLALNNTYGTNYLIIQHHEKPLRNITIIASVIGMLIAIPLVYYYSYIGAAITILISRAILGISTWAVAQNIKRTLT